MILSLSLTLVVGLVTSSFAAPLGSVNIAETRTREALDLGGRAAGTVPASVNCGGTSISRTQILNALNAAYRPGQGLMGKQYPAFFGNRGRDAARRTISVLNDPAAVLLVPIFYTNSFLGLGLSFTLQIRECWEPSGASSWYDRYMAK